MHRCVHVRSFELMLVLFCCLGNAISALGKNEDALLVWEQGYEHALHQSADLKQLLELEELLTKGKQGCSIQNETHGAPVPQSETISLSSGSLSENCNSKDRLSSPDKLCDISTDTSEVCLKSDEKFDSSNKLHDEDRNSNKSDDQANGSPDVLDKLSYNSESCNDSSDTSESCEKVSTSRESFDITEIFKKPNKKFDLSLKINDDARGNKKFCVARISKSKSISVDFRLSRGIAEVCVMILIH